MANKKPVCVSFNLVSLFTLDSLRLFYGGPLAHIFFRGLATLAPLAPLAHIFSISLAQLAPHLVKSHCHLINHR
jgi:hypothetical protein